MKNFTIAAAVALALTTAAHAASDPKGHAHSAKASAAHAHEAKAQHGGVVSVAKDMNCELVAKDSEVVLGISDHGAPVSLAGATARLALLSVTQKQGVALAPADNALRAKGAFTVAAGTKAVVSVQLKDQPKSFAKFTLP